MSSSSSSFPSSSLRALLVLWSASAAWIAWSYLDVGAWTTVRVVGGEVFAGDLRGPWNREEAADTERSPGSSIQREKRPQPAVLLEAEVAGLTYRVEQFAVFPAKIDINTAPPRLLSELAGIGPSLAGRIVEYRSHNGPFANVEELVNVSGIGPKTIERIRGRVKP